MSGDQHQPAHAANVPALWRAGVGSHRCDPLRRGLGRRVGRQEGGWRRLYSISGRRVGGGPQERGREGREEACQLRAAPVLQSAARRAGRTAPLLLDRGRSVFRAGANILPVARREELLERRRLVGGRRRRRRVTTLPSFPFYISRFHFHLSTSRKFRQINQLIQCNDSSVIPTFGLSKSSEMEVTILKEHTVLTLEKLQQGNMNTWPINPHQGALSFFDGTSPPPRCLKNLSSISFHRIENMIPCKPLATIFVSRPRPKRPVHPSSWRISATHCE